MPTVVPPTAFAPRAAAAITSARPPVTTVAPRSASRRPTRSARSSCSVPLPTTETWIATTRRMLRDGLETRVLAESPPELAGRAPVRQDHVGREIVRPADQRGAHAVRIHRHAALLERADLLGGEAAGGDDPHSRAAGVVERAANLTDEPLVHAGRLEVAHLVPQRAVDERL